MRRRVLRLIASFLLGLLACARSSPPVPLRIAVHSDPLSLDPHLQNEVLTYSMLANVFDALTTLDAELKVKPNLALAWENPDDVTWRFRLRPDARFHDGRPVEAEDVAASLQRAKTHPRSNMASYLVEVASVRALDARTVEVTTRKPFAALLNKLAFIFVVPRDAPEQITSPIGSGSYRFASFAPGRSLKLEPARADWRPERAELPLEFLPIPDPNERADRLIAGDVDIVQELQPAQVRRVQAAPGCRVMVRSSSVVEYLHLRAGDSRFSDRRVREAIHLSLDRDLLVQRILEGHGEPASQLVAPGVFGYEPALVAPKRDLDRARWLLAEAGHAKGFDVALHFRQGRRGEEIARQLGELGLRVSLESAPWTELYPRLRRSEVPFYFGGVAAPTSDASDILDSFAHSRETAKGYGNTNFNAYANPALDALVEQAASSPAMLQRRRLLQKAMRVLVEDLYLIPLFVPYDLYGVRREILWEPHLDRMLLGREMRRLRGVAR